MRAEAGGPTCLACESSPGMSDQGADPAGAHDSSTVTGAKPFIVD